MLCLKLEGFWALPTNYSPTVAWNLEGTLSDLLSTLSAKSCSGGCDE